MTDRFDQFVSGISLCYKHIQRIKNLEMTEFGLKGTQVMCIFYLKRHPEGLTSAQLVNLCQEDKAAVSRTLSELSEGGYVESAEGAKRYRAPMRLSEKGLAVAAKVDELVADWVAVGGAGLTEAERIAFYHALEIISRNLRESYSNKTV